MSDGPDPAPQIEPSAGPRERVKGLLARAGGRSAAAGITVLIYHRIAGVTRDELDLSPTAFRRQVDLLARHDVIGLDDAVDRLERADARPAVVLTFDDGFEDVYDNAWPLLRERRLPFTIYLASGFVGGTMAWEGSTATGAAGQGLTWAQLAEMVDSGLCTIGNHTHGHVRPEALTAADLDECTSTIEDHLGVRPAHFTYPWGVVVPDREADLRARFRSASTGELGRNQPGCDLMRLRRVPVRRTDPDAFFAAKLRGRLGPERTYAAIVRLAKAAGVSA